MDKQLYIDGKWTDGTGESLIEVINPATEEVIARVPQASSNDVDAAITSARREFDAGWGRSTPAQRQEVLRRLFEVLNRRKGEIIDTVIAEVGTPRTLAGGLQVQIPLDHFQDMVERVLSTFRFETGMPPTYGNGIGQGAVLREPAGVVAAITPFNYPFFVNMSKLGPILASGCTAVLKPSPLTPLTALLIAEAVEEAEVPAGVVGVVTGDVEAGRALTSHAEVDVVTFTGSVPVGSEIMRQAAAGIKRVVLELGGKNAIVVLEDADLDRAIPAVAYGLTRNSGQGCGNMSRVLVHESIHDDVVHGIVTMFSEYVVGDPRDAKTDMGPMVSEAQRDRVERYVQIGLGEGATLATGGSRPAGLDRGYFVEPTLFVDVKSSMRIAQEEIFGPVGSVISFSDDAEAVEIANDSHFGLSGAVFSGDPRRGFNLARQIRTGQITLNGGGGGTNPYAPYGGYKQSGIGREFGEAGLNEYLETKAIMWGAR